MKHLDLLNAVLALRFRQPGWPTVLADAGYLVHGVGVPFKLADGAVVAPDVLATSTARRTSLLVEVKGGASFDHDQLGRMEKVGPADLRDAAYLRIDDVASHRIAIVIVCNAAQHDSFVRAAEGRPASIVSFDGMRFTFGGAALPDPNLQHTWSTAQVEPGAPHVSIIPFDHESDLGTVARAAIPEALALLVNGAGNFSADTILLKTHSVCHGVMQSTGSGTDFGRIRKRLVDMLTEASKSELSAWISRVPGQAVWTFAAGLPADLTTRTRELKALQRDSLALIERLGGGKGVQLGLFDDSTLGSG